eukprot:6062139-Pleurochrysis_carterae.AAC.1
MPFNSRSKSATSAKTMRMDVALAVAVKVVDITVAAEYPARFTSFEGAVVVELVGDNPLDLADERVLWTLNQ